ncbi:MAG: acetate kinase [Paludibacteraceae bacterium]|nr:acetate kinase [Paludibacteraceae bacterium]
MKVLVLNCGSSSIKYKLFDMENQSVMASGGVEKLGLKDSFLKIKFNDGSKKIIEKFMHQHTEGVQLILESLTNPEYGCIKNLNEIEAVGHRVVHGGETFDRSVIVTPEVLKTLDKCNELAPLHNPANLMGVEAIENILPGIPQVLTFDTSFHQTMPDYAYMYALPYQYYEKYGVRRYGFHGTSHRFVSKRACEFLGLDVNNSKLITCHLGGGGSVTAILNGKSIDTSMGMTPTEGLVMGTRVGDVDPAVIPFLMEKENLDIEATKKLIQKQSGVAGVSCLSSDMRDIEDGIAKGDKKSILTMDMFNYRLLKYIGAYMAVLGGVDAIIFTGGIGERQPETREYICEKLAYLGVKYDAKLNNEAMSIDAELSTPDSKIKVAVITTDEELTIARDTYELVRK